METFQRIVMWFALGGLGVLLPVLAAISLRRSGALDGLSRGLEKFRRLPAPARVLVGLFICVAVVHGSTKQTDPNAGQDGTGDGAESGEVGGVGDTGGDGGLAGAPGADGDGDPTGSAGGDSGADSDLSGDPADDPIPDGGEWPGEGGLMAFTLDLPGPFTAEELALGAIAVGTGTGEEFSFAPPEGARVIDLWRLRGAADEAIPLEDGEAAEGAAEGFPGSGWLLFSDGRIRDCRSQPGWEYAPLHTVLGVVPEANWAELPEGVSASRVWTQERADAFVVTWENVLVGRTTNDIVSFQAEFARSGRVTYRYGGVGLDVLTNAVIGIARPSGVLAVSPVEGMTSATFHVLDPEDAEDWDRDGDGVSTRDEMCLYGTDPGAADTDGDGISDGEEIAAGTDPKVRDFADGAIAERLAAGATNETMFAEFEVLEDELSATKLWDAFAFEVGVDVGGAVAPDPQDGDLAARGSEQDGASGAVLYERTVQVDRKGGWQRYFLSSRFDRAGAWELFGATLEWEDDAGGSGTVAGSAVRDSVMLPVSEFATSVTLRLVGAPGEVRSRQPVYLLAYTPRFEVSGGREILLDDGTLAYVFVKGEDPDPAVTVDRSARPSRGEAGADEPAMDGFDLPTEAGVWPVFPWEMNARRGRSGGSGNGPRIVILNPSMSYGTAHGGWLYGVDYADGLYRKNPRFPLDTEESWYGWWQGPNGWNCGCEPSVSTGLGEDPIARGVVTRRDDESADGMVTVGGTPVWYGSAMHTLYWSTWHPEEKAAGCGCPESCPHCHGKPKDGASTGSIRFRVSLGSTSDGKDAGYVYFHSEGPVTVTTDLFETLARPGTSISDETASGVRTVSAPGANGRWVTIAATTNGVSLAVGPNGSAATETWALANGADGSVGIVRRDAVGEILEDWTYVCEEGASGGWRWTAADNVAGTGESVETDDRLNADGTIRTVRKAYDAAGGLVREETVFERLEGEGAEAHLVTVSNGVLTVGTDARGKRTERTVSEADGVIVTAEEVTGTDTDSSVRTVMTEFPNGSRTVRTEWDGKWTEEREIVSWDPWNGRIVTLVSDSSDYGCVTNGIRTAGSSLPPVEEDGSTEEDEYVPTDEELAFDAAVEAGTTNVTTVCDSFGRIVAVTNAIGEWASFAYDSVGNVTEFSCSNGTLRATYDTRGNRILLDDSDWNDPEEEPAPRMRLMSRSAGGVAPPEHQTGKKCLEYYLSGGGDRSMYFSEVSLKRFSLLDFPCVKRHLTGCPKGDLTIGEDTKGNTLVVETIGTQQSYIGHMTVRLTGTLQMSSGCGWTLANGRLEGLPDVYDFNKAKRVAIAECMVKVGRSLKNGTPFKIHFVGSKPMTGSGGCGGL